MSASLADGRTPKGRTFRFTVVRSLHNAKTIPGELAAADGVIDAYTLPGGLSVTCSRCRRYHRADRACPTCGSAA